MSEGMQRFFYFKGRVALSAILESLDIGAGDEVLLQGFTCVVVPNAIIYRGAIPVYLDIDPTTYNLDLQQLRDTRGTRWTPGKAKAIIVQHTFGLPTDIDEIAEFAAENDLAVIEDAAHALGSRYKGREVGTLGDAAFFSSQWTKPIPTGVGGWAVSKNRELARRLADHHEATEPPPNRTSLLLFAQYLAWRAVIRPSLYWPVRDTYRWFSRHGLVVASSTEDELDHRQPEDYMRRMAWGQQHMLERMIELDEPRRAHSKVLRRKYEKIVRDASLEPLTIPEGSDPVLLRYPVQVARRDWVLEQSRRRRVELGDWFATPVHPSTHDWGTLKYERGMCPVAERVGEDVINLPVNRRVDDAFLERVAALLGEVEPP